MIQDDQILNYFLSSMPVAAYAKDLEGQYVYRNHQWSSLSQHAVTKNRQCPQDPDIDVDLQRHEENEDAPAAKQKMTRLLTGGCGGGRRRGVLRVDGHREIRLPAGAL